jgi:hypothetical protein
MSGEYYFFEAGHSIILQARMEGRGGMLGDALEEIRPGQSFRGLSYQELKDAKAGKITIAGGKAHIADAG